MLEKLHILLISKKVSKKRQIAHHHSSRGDFFSLLLITHFKKMSRPTKKRNCPSVFGDEQRR